MTARELFKDTFGYLPQESDVEDKATISFAEAYANQKNEELRVKFKELGILMRKEANEAGKENEALQKEVDELRTLVKDLKEILNQ